MLREIYDAGGDLSESQKILEGLANFIMPIDYREKEQDILKGFPTHLTLQEGDGDARVLAIPPGLSATIERLLSEECYVCHGDLVVSRVPRRDITSEMLRLFGLDRTKNYVVDIKRGFYHYHCETKDVLFRILITEAGSYSPQKRVLRLYRGEWLLTETLMASSNVLLTGSSRLPYEEDIIRDWVASHLLSRDGYGRQPEIAGLRLTMDGSAIAVPEGLAARIDEMLNRECDVRDGDSGAVVSRVPRHAVDAELARLHREQPDKNHVVHVDEYFYKYHRETKDVAATGPAGPRTRRP
jgi:hypothetical protein